MKVLLTGANGFVGSHILDSLRSRGIATVALLRPSSDRSLIAAQLAGVEVRLGSLGDPASLDAALGDVTHVVHCAGCTKALRVEEFYRVNRDGTRHLVEAINRSEGKVSRLVDISSLAAGGPAGPDRPARESDAPHPVSEYGRSKLAGEREVQTGCRSEYVILRPAAVYGPRDTAFLSLFKAVRGHVLPKIGGDRMRLSLVYVQDLAEAAVACLTAPTVAGQTLYVAASEVTTSGAMAAAIAAQMRTWTLALPLPTAALWPLCVLQDAVARLTGKPSVLSLQKYPELRAVGWVCDPSRLRTEGNFICATGLTEGIAATLAWYRREGWL